MQGRAALGAWERSRLSHNKWEGTLASAEGARLGKAATKLEETSQKKAHSGRPAETDKEKQRSEKKIGYQKKAEIPTMVAFRHDRDRGGCRSPTLGSSKKSN